MRRIHLTVVLGVLLAFTAACTNKKSVNPLARVGSKQPDKFLFDKAMDAMHHNRFDVASYLDYYHRSRTHLSLGKDSPEPPEMVSVVALPQVGGLYHRYERRVA